MLIHSEIPTQLGCGEISGGRGIMKCHLFVGELGTGTVADWVKERACGSNCDPNNKLTPESQLIS